MYKFPLQYSFTLFQTGPSQNICNLAEPRAAFFSLARDFVRTITHTYTHTSITFRAVLDREKSLFTLFVFARTRAACRCVASCWLRGSVEMKGEPTGRWLGRDITYCIPRSRSTNRSLVGNYADYTCFL